MVEQDGSALRSDREVLFRAVGKHEVRDALVYEHLPARSEPLRWIPDAAACAGPEPARCPQIVRTSRPLSVGVPRAKVAG